MYNGTNTTTMYQRKKKLKLLCRQWSMQVKSIKRIRKWAKGKTSRHANLKPYCVLNIILQYVSIILSFIFCSFQLFIFCNRYIYIFNSLRFTYLKFTNHKEYCGKKQKQRHNKFNNKCKLGSLLATSNQTRLTGNKPGKQRKTVTGQR